MIKKSYTSLFINFINLIVILNCKFFDENKPVQNPGLGIKKTNDIYTIHFDVGIFTFENYTIKRDDIEKLFVIVSKDLEDEWKNIKLYPVFDQPQDAPFLMERVVSKKIHPNIQTFELQSKFLYYNNFIVQENLKENTTVKPKFFLSSQLHYYLFSQVRYDLLIIPLPILSDFDYDNKRKEIEIHHYEIGLAKGRTALDKIAVIVHLDYENLYSQKNINTIKSGLISLILNVPENISTEFLNKKCNGCVEYMELRKKIFEIFYSFNSGNVRNGCEKLSKDWFDWYLHKFIETHNRVIQKQMEQNFENLKKKCKRL